MDFEKENEYIGDIAQLISLKESRLCGGRQEGVRLVEISNGAGLDISILPDRCMDFYQIRFQGINLNYLTPAGIVAPQFYDNRGLHWLRSFNAGFLTTCGLQNIGGPDFYNGNEHGLHGRLASTPAEDFYAVCDMAEGIPTAKVKGKMREAVLFGENLSLKREIAVPYGKNEIYFTDTVTNHGFKKNHYMLLYHFNYGYPLLDEHTEIFIDTKNIEPRNEHAAKYADQWNKIMPPQDNFEEMCYFHKVALSEKGVSGYSIYNPTLNIGVTLEYDGQALDNFCQWKMLGKGEYVLGLEPCNSELDGYEKAMEKGMLKFLEPQQSISLQFKLSFYNK